MISGIAVSAAMADVLDDVGLSVADFARIYQIPEIGASGTRHRGVTGLPISEAHAAGIAAELKKKGAPWGESSFLEGIGNFAKALELNNPFIPPLDRVRLLVRAGREEEARAALGEENIRPLAESLEPESLLRHTCRPLEDAAAWDELRALLRLLATRLTSPEWRLALWAEELDLAWHLDEVPALLQRSAGDPLRLAVFHYRLGNKDERDRLAAGLLEEAPSARVAEVFAMLRDSPPVRIAALALWNRPELAAEDRAALYLQMIRLREPGVAEIFQTWVKNGGDAMPLADLIWRRGLPGPAGSSARGALVAALHTRHPDEPRFRLMRGCELMKTDPQRAAELFEQVAELPLTATPNTRQRVYPAIWKITHLANIPEAPRADLAYVAIRGLALLDRQDRIRAMLDRRAAEWAALPTVDQMRYLTAGDMDFELVKTVLEADFAKPENDRLAEWLHTALSDRAQSRTLPKETLAQVAEKFSALAAGGPQKDVYQSVSDAGSLLRLPGSGEIDAQVWLDRTHKLAAILKERDPKKAENLTASLQSVARDQPWARVLLADGTMPAGDGSVNISRQMRSWGMISLFLRPKICRIGPVEAYDRHRWENPMPVQGVGPLPLDALERWSDAFGPHGRGIPPMSRLANEQDQVAWSALIREFPVGSPQRMPVEILIANDVLDCGEALKAEAKASFAALMAGEKEARGTELFRYAVGAQAGNEEALKKILAEIKSQPPSVRERFIRQLQARSRNEAGFQLAMRELGQPAATPKPAVSGPDEDTVKLRELLKDKLAATQEAVALARRILGKAAAVDHNSPQQDDTSQAASVLASNGLLDDWLLETRQDLTRSGVPPVEILRRLHRLDNRQENREKSRTLALARDILALDPADLWAARELAGPAAEARDRELLLTCLLTMGQEALPMLMRPEILSGFGTDADLVLSLVRDVNPGGNAPGQDAVGALHRYFLNADPTLAARFRNWLAGLDGPPKGSRFLLAGQLLDAGRNDEAVDAIASEFITPPEYPGFPHQFPPKPGASTIRQSGHLDVKDLEPDLNFLRERKLFPAVLARLESRAAADPLVLATFRMAVTPDDATFDRYAKPVLKKLGHPYHGATAQRWIELFQKQPATGPLLLRLLEERSDEAGSSNSSYQQASYIRIAATQPGSAPLIARMWAKFSQAATDPAKKDGTVREMASLLREMLVSADDATWRDYWAWRRNEAEPLGDLSFTVMGSAPTGFVGQARLRQILPRLLKENGTPLPDRTAAGIALLAVAAGDPAMLEQVKAAMPANHGAAALCDLGLGKTAGTAPVFGAAPEENGETLLSWNLVGISSENPESKVANIPRHPFTALDGKLDLQFKAGSDPDHLEIMSTLPAAPAAGHVRLKLTPEQRYVAIIARDPAGGIVRPGRALDVQSSSGTPLPLSDKNLTGKGFEKLAQTGPGGMPAWKIRFSGRESIDLFEHPWSAEQSFALGAWVSGNGELKLRCLDAAGKELQAFDLAAWDSLIPVWQFVSIRVPERQRIPDGTVRLVISASVYGHNDGPLDFAFSNVRMKFGAPVDPPPEN